jgi:DNA-binding HxlR family transcriptional regulator
MALFDLMGRRHAMRIVWELRNGPLSFRQLQQNCGDVSSSVLNQRVRDLRAAGIVSAGGIELTEEGHQLLKAYEPLTQWARRWAARA